MRSFAALMLRVRHGLEWGNLPSSALPAAIGVFALALRLYGLGDKPFWLDEIASLRRATATLPDLVVNSLNNNHYPSYFLLLWLVGQIGTSQWLLRLPSAVFGAVGASLTCAIGTRAAGRPSGAIAGLLMAVSPFEVQFGQEARSYTLVSCLILTALFGLVRLAQEPAAAALPMRNGALRGAWMAYCLGTAAALSVLNVAIPWLLAANLGAIAIGRRAGDNRRAFLRNWGLAQALILAIWIPSLAWVFAAGKGAVLDGAGWAPAETSKTIWAIVAPVYLLRISSFITFGLLPSKVPGLAVVSVTLAALGAWRLRRDTTVLAVLGCAAIVLPLGLFLLSLFVPVLVPRYFAWSAGPFFVFAGAGLGRLSFPRLAPATAMLGAAGMINLMPYYDYETKPRWDLLAAQSRRCRPAGRCGPARQLLFLFGAFGFCRPLWSRRPSGQLDLEFAGSSQACARPHRLGGLWAHWTSRQKAVAGGLSPDSRPPGTPGIRKFGRTLHRVVAVQPAERSRQNRTTASSPGRLGR